MRNKVLLCVCVVLAFITSNLTAATFTLSDSALMSLDYKYSGVSTSVVSVTNVAGAGVRFDLLYPDPLNANGQKPVLYLTSSIYGGSGSLTGIDISSFDAFALKITLISVAGVSSADAVGPIIVGALINQLDSDYAYHPDVIAIDSPISATSTTATNANQITNIGFVCNIPYWWYSSSSSPWDPTGATISILVESAPDAVIIPEPATILLLTLGGLVFRKRK